MTGACSPSEFIRLARQRQAEGHLSLLRQLAELLVLYPVYGVGPGYYQLAGFWRRSVPWADKTAHLSVAAYRAAVNRLNRPAYHKLSQNKIAEKAILRLHDVPASEYLGHFDPLNGRTLDGRPLRNATDLEHFCGSFTEGTKLCFKPVEGWGGKGIEVVATDGPGEAGLRRLATGEAMTPAALCERVLAANGRAWVVEAYLEQHPAMARFNPSSVNTLRLWTLCHVGRNPRVVLGYLRIGRGGSIVDNQSSGGIVAPVDLETGVLREAIDGCPSRRAWTRHPDHGAPIAGVALPHFRASLELAARCLAAFPGIRFAGMDVAVTPTGPRIIEMNVSPDREGAAFVDVPTKRILRMDTDARRPAGQPPRPSPGAAGGNTT